MKMIIRERYLKKIRPYYESDLIKVITGIRRCGKSIILSQIKDEIGKAVSENNIIFIDLESVKDRKIDSCDKLEDKISSVISGSQKYYIFIDEIQNIKDFEIALASIRNSFNCSVFVTGSNSKLLNGKLQDKLTGRAKEFEIFPFTFMEYLEFKRINNEEINEDDDFLDYLELGGMPQRFLENGKTETRKYLNGIYTSIIKKDVFHGHQKINKNEFQKVSNYVISTTGTPFSSLGAVKQLQHGITNEEAKKKSATVINYLGYLVECYLITECKPHYMKGKEHFNGTKKYYCMDVGIRNALGTIFDYDNTFALEGIIYNELLVRGYDVRYVKLRDGEIDFAVINNDKKCFIQVAYYMESEKTLEREYSAFQKIKDSSPKFVLSLDKKDTSRNGITHLNVVDFLTNKTDIFFS